MKSIREFASHINVSHSTVSAHMERLGITGQSQGPGKATLLTDDECLRLDASIRPVAEPLPVKSVEVVLEPTDIQPVESPQYIVPDSTFARGIQKAQTSRNIQGWKKNLAQLRRAMLETAQEQGRQLGAEMLATMLDTTMATFDQASAEAAKDLGLTQESSDEQ